MRRIPFPCVRHISFSLDERSRLALGYLVSQENGAPLRFVLSKALVMAAVAQGWQAVDLRAYLAPEVCAFCTRPLPAGTVGERIYCSPSCKQQAYMQRKMGRKIQTRLHEREVMSPLKGRAEPVPVIQESLSAGLDANALAAMEFLLGRSGSRWHSRLIQGVLIQVALDAGWQDVDIRGWFDPRRCAFCGKPIPEGMNQNTRHCSHLCVQAAYYERKTGRRTVSRIRGDRPHCGACGVELPVGSTARRCPDCRAKPRPSRRMPKPVLPVVPVVPEARTCPECGSSFEVRPTSHRVYCSALCKSRAKERRRAPRRWSPRVKRS